MTSPQVALRALTRDTRWVVLDVETTDTDQGRRILSVGIAQWRLDQPAGTQAPAPIEWYTDPGPDVTIGNTRIHGITRKTLDDRKARPFAEHITSLNTLLRPVGGERVVLVAHNAHFDVPVLHLEYARAGQTLPDVPVLDTMWLASWLDLPGRKKLDTLLNLYGHARTKKHDALADATDTAILLRELLRDAAKQGVRDLTAEHPSTGKESIWRTTSGYAAAPADRGARASRRSPFTFIERPAVHDATHKALPKNPTDTQITAWYADVRECVRLRCPALPRKIDGLRVQREAVAERLLAEWREHLEAHDLVSANTCLGAGLSLLVKTMPAADAPAWIHEWEPHLAYAERCAPPSPEIRNPVDACPDCRADRACPGDTWPSSVAMLLLGVGRSFNITNTTPWRGTDSRLAQLATTGGSAYAAPAAWHLFEMLSNKHPNVAEDVADLADSLNLVHPRLVIARARALELAGEPAEAIAQIAAGAAHRGSSSDRGWLELADLQDAIQARASARARRAARATRPFRDGHSAPDSRPDRRRFTLTTTGEAPATKARKRKDRQRHASR